MRKKHPKDEFMWRWELKDVGLSSRWRIVDKLVQAGIVRLAYKSRQYQEYILTDYELVKQAVLNYFKGKGLEVEGKAIIPETATKYANPEYLSITPPEDFLDVVEGYEDLKWLLKLAVLNPGIHFIFYGPPGIGKSIILLELERLPGAYYVTAGEVSKAGLLDVIYDLKPRFILIDELDKIKSPKELTFIYELASTGRVKEVKAVKSGRYREIVIACNIFASANKIDHFPSEFRDRFWIIEMQQYDIEQARRITVNYLVKREGVPLSIATTIASKLVEEKKLPSVRKAVMLWKLIQPIYVEKKKEEDVAKAIDRAIKILEKYKSLKHARKALEQYTNYR